VDIATLQVIKCVLLGTAAVLILASWFIDRLRIPAGRKVCDAFLIVLAAISACAYFDFGQYPKFHQFMNPHDLFHYYLGSKYSREMGYFHLYQCVTIADYENHGKRKRLPVRKMEDYEFVPADAVIHDAATYKAGFSPERWEEFKRDTAFFESMLGAGRWGTVVQDMGYNATPVWNMVGRWITNRVPTSHPNAIFALTVFDLALISAMILMVWRAFKWRTALWALVFFCTCFCMGYTHIRGGFFRVDWVTMLVMTVCALKMGRYKTGGALLGYAGMARVFPLVFAFGMGAKFAWDFLKTWRLNRRYLEFFITFGLVCIALVALSAWDDGGFEHWAQFANKISVHNNHIAPPRVGFKKLFLMNYSYPPGGMPGLKQAFADRKVYWLLIQGTVLLVSLYLVRRLEDYESICYGYVLAYFLTAPTFYYHVMLTVALFVFLPKRDRFPRAAAVVYLFLVSGMVFVLNRYMPFSFELAFILSAALLAFVLYVMLTAFFARPEPEVTQALPDAPPQPRPVVAAPSAKTKPRSARRRRHRSR